MPGPLKRRHDSTPLCASASASASRTPGSPTTAGRSSGCSSPTAGRLRRRERRLLRLARPHRSRPGSGTAPGKRATHRVARVRHGSSTRETWPSLGDLRHRRAGLAHPRGAPAPALHALPDSGRLRADRDAGRADHRARDRPPGGISSAFFRFYFDSPEPGRRRTVLRTSFWFTMTMSTLGLALGVRSRRRSRSSSSAPATPPTSFAPRVSPSGRR